MKTYTRSMPILILQHSDHGGPGRLGACLRDHGFRLDFRRPDQHAADPRKGVPPDLDGVQGLVILGGPMMVTELDKTPWMQAEAALIEQAHETRVPMVGICLGAQLIAQTLGGEVDWKEKPMIGMSRVSVNTTGQVDTLFAGIAWYHPQFFSCSQEVKQPPPGSTLLASAPGTPNAAFRVGLRTAAFQYHFECDRPMLDQLGKETCGSAGDKACTTTGDLAGQFDRDYETYGRLSDRLCVNLVTYLFRR